MPWQQCPVATPQNPCLFLREPVPGPPVKTQPWSCSVAVCIRLRPSASQLVPASARVGATVPRRRGKWLFFLCTAQHVGCPRGSAVKNLPANAGDVGLSPGMGRFPEEEVAARSSLLAWRIPWTEEPAESVKKSWIQLSTHVPWDIACGFLLPTQGANLHPPALET